uniref:Uncharacterized protein n=1 Tax=Arundo donax TaxID=35708 RepID=A0A0A9HDW2_ARUDO
MHKFDNINATIDSFPCDKFKCICCSITLENEGGYKIAYSLRLKDVGNFFHFPIYFRPSVLNPPD